MVPQRKIEAVDNIVEKLNKSKAVVLADYRGLKVLQINELRAKIKKAGASLEVVKNTLLGKAADQAEVKIDQSALKEPTIVLWINEEDFEPLKVLVNFAKENSSPKIKIGLLNKAVIDEAKVKSLALLPSKDELRAKVIGMLLSPATRVDYALTWNIRKLIYILKAVKPTAN